MDTGNRQVKLVYITGYGRSGSTLLDRLLGQVDGFCPVGEFFWIWKKGFGDNELCGCGKPVRQCEFWNAVATEAFGGIENINTEETSSLMDATSRIWHFPLLAWPAFATAKYLQKLKKVQEILSSMYLAIQKVSGSDFIVDSSKLASFELVLSRLSNIELYAIHLVRDSRAVAYSSQRIKAKPEVYWKTATMDRRNVFHASVVWSVSNWFSQLTRNRVPHYERIRYEELASDPKATLSRITRGLGKTESNFEFLTNERSFKFNLHHTISGNPNRFERGAIEIRPDLEWQSKMHRGAKGLVTVLTWLLLREYGYLNAQPGTSDRVA